MSAVAGLIRTGREHRHAGRLAEAEAALRQALRLDPAADEAAYSLAFTLLGLGRWAEAWPLHEVRRRIPGLATPTPIVEAPEWTGEPLAGKRLVVCVEQGFGDQILFGRFLRVVEGQGAEIVVACHPLLARLFRSCGWATAPFFTDRPLPGGDFWTLIGSLPHRLGDIAPVEGRYIPAPAATAQGGIGVVVRGNPANPIDAARVLAPDLAARLLALGRDLSPEATGAGDFFDTAQIIAGLDLVVSVDTAVAHLAASLGKPTWILVPASPVDWRYGLCGPSPWHPHARLLRASPEGGWRPVVEGVLEALG